ncbi:Alpha beta-hydrolase [Mycena chlorophos]|uniref:Alpha beta-hydrolase n=1 Tax=Mycena chlorophos TaxID=658473 RepID=A0A8H6SEB5_MYCCL|nr:Alpha beta-hydrolase [Mycena chlorophos]
MTAAANACGGLRPAAFCQRALLRSRISGPLTLRISGHERRLGFRSQALSTMAQANGDLETYVNKEGIKVIERFFDLPLDYSNPTGEKIRVFARNLIPRSKAKTLADEEKLPYMVYFQGGPGFEVDLQGSSGFAAEIHEQGYQTLWLDQRGTGLSTPLTSDTLPERLVTDEEKADYFKHFRADNIVRDAEEIRKILLGHKSDPEDQKWSIVGQSFGGFCAITYLSFFPQGLKEVFMTGGLAPLDDGPDRVYASLIPILKKRNEIYYNKYPKDIKRVRDIVAYLEANNIQLPNGGTLSVPRFQELGMMLGMSGGIDRLHQLVFRMTNDLELFSKFSPKTLQTIQGCYPFDGNPIYAILHEPVYCQGTASKWSAARILSNHSAFSWASVKGLAETEPIYFTGEMVLPHTFDDHVNLRPLKGVAEILANDSSWGKLYDIEQLKKNEVKVSAATYYYDMYVQFDLAQETAATIKNTEQYITNQLHHDGIRADAKDVMKRLFQLSRREYD